MSELRAAGEELRQRREELGLELEDAFRRTRILPEYLRALERGDLSGLPAPSFGPGFVRTYCRYLGLEPERYVMRYEGAGRPARRRPVRPRYPRIDLVGLLNPKLNLPSWTGRVAAWAVICGIVALGWLTFTLVLKPSTDVRDRAQAEALEMVVPSAADAAEY